MVSNLNGESNRLNNFAVSNADIVDALQVSSVAMQEANNSFDETVALITAGTEITQDANRVGNALRTISMRIRGMNEESEEFDDTLSNIKGDVYDLTKGQVSIMEDADTYKSTTQVLREVSNVWDTLTDKDQAQLLDKLFGKNRAQVGGAIISNFSQVEAALDKMANSAGDAEREMGVVMESLNFKFNALKETGTGIFQNLFPREDVGAAVDALTGVLSVVDSITEKAGLLGTAGIVGGITAFVTKFGKNIALYGCESIAA